MLRIKYPQVFVGAGLLVVGLYFWWLSASLSASAAEYPRIILALMLGIGVVMLVRGFRDRPSSVAYEYSGVGVPVALTLVYIGLFGRLDFRILTALYVLAMIWKHPTNWSLLRKALLAAVTSTALYTIFVRGFNLPIP